MAENKTKYTTLQAENGTVLYPKTSVNAVKDFDTKKTQKEINKEVETDVEALKKTSNDVVSDVTRLKSQYQDLKDSQKFQGAYTSVSSFPSIPSDIKKAEGWYAILKVSNGNDKFYIVDQTEREWVEKGESTSIIYDGIKKVNGLEGLEGNVTIDATNINATVNGETKTIQDTLIGLKNISDEQKELIETVAAKHNVLYVTEAEMQDIDEIEDGQVVVCVEDGTYAQGSIYKLVQGVWEEITASGTEITDTLTLSKEVFVPGYPSGKITIDSVENLSSPYGFELNENGFYESNNQKMGNSYSLCKVTFTVPQPRNLVLDVINSGEDNYDFGIFSNIGQTLSSNYKEDTDSNLVYKSYKTASSTNVVQLTYENVDAGQHFITVKYRKDSGTESGNDSLQFKLNSASEEIYPSIDDKYTQSSSSITVGDENNLQINGKNILKEGDVNQSILLEIGDSSNPIILQNWNDGFHLCKGYYKTSQQSGYKDFFENEMFFYKGGSQLIIFGGYPSSYIIKPFKNVSGETVGQITMVSIGNDGYLQTSGIPLALDNVASILGKSSRSKDWCALGVNNNTTYEPTNNYNPATKKYVDDTIVSNVPIVLNEKPTSDYTYKNINRFAYKTNNNELYYYYGEGSKIAAIRPEVGLEYTEIYLNKNT